MLMVLLEGSFEGLEGIVADGLRFRLDKVCEDSKNGEPEAFLSTKMSRPCWDLILF